METKNTYRMTIAREGLPRQVRTFRIGGNATRTAGKLFRSGATAVEVVKNPEHVVIFKMDATLPRDLWIFPQRPAA